jgi:ligand-binding SRPBCC domain-containing protein
MTTFVCQSEFSTSAQNLFSFHEQPEGFETLIGLTKGVEIIQRPTSLEIGQTAILRVPILPFVKVKWIARHIDYVKGSSFTDTQVEGPFQIFKHLHRIESLANGNSILSDIIHVQFFLWPISKWFVLFALKKQFKERHLATSKFLNCDSKLLFCGYSGSVIN